MPLRMCVGAHICVYMSISLSVSAWLCVCICMRECEFMFVRGDAPVYARKSKEM